MSELDGLHVFGGSAPERWRKKPVVIEARQWDGSPAVVFWVNSNGGCTDSAAHVDDLVIATLEGDMTVRRGDFIIRGVKGEFYPCKPDIFYQTYEPAQETSDERT